MIYHNSLLRPRKTLCRRNYDNYHHKLCNLNHKVYFIKRVTIPGSQQPTRGANMGIQCVGS